MTRFTGLLKYLLFLASCQVSRLAYGFHHPDKQKALYLFDYETVDLENVRAVCNSANIEVMLEPQKT
jgi:hypothetical protein